MATAPPMKMETDGGSFIKPDPDSMHQPQPMDEDDGFEDTGELEMPSQPQQVWLLRIPRVLHEQWNKIDSDQEIQLGVIRRGKRSGKVFMDLDPKLPFHRTVERDYTINPMLNLTPTDGSDMQNTYIFSEKDLPGYKKGQKNNRGAAGHNDAPGHPKAGIDKTRRFQRRAIPKQTRVEHVITKASNSTSVENDTTRAMRLLRQREEEENRREVKLDMEEGFAPEIQSLMNLNKNRKDMIGANRGKAAKPKPQENKASRMPRNDLLDRLFECFQHFQFWSMKALRDKLNQPEAYLKEVLDGIADLVRSGRFNGLYTLKAENRAETFNFDAVKEEAAPEESDLEALSGGDDEEMGDASDVKGEPT